MDNRQNLYSSLRREYKLRRAEFDMLKRAGITDGDGVLACLHIMNAINRILYRAGLEPFDEVKDEV